MESVRSEDQTEEFRVQVTSKKLVSEQIRQYKDVLKTALDGQTEETKRDLLQELLANFEAAVQLNVLVNGQPWEEAPDDGDDVESVDLESQLDDAIVETARRRRTFPKKILPHVVRSLKAERKLMGLYEGQVKPQEMLKDPDRESIMSDLSTEAPGAVKSAVQIVKSIAELQQQAEGLCEILDMKPSRTTLEIQNIVFDQSDAPVLGPTGSRQPIERALEEAAATECYRRKHKSGREADTLQPQH